MDRIRNNRKRDMRRIIPILAASLLVLSCSKEIPVTPDPPVPEKTSGEKVDSILLSTAASLAEIKLETIDDIINFILHNIDISLSPLCFDVAIKNKDTVLVRVTGHNPLMAASVDSVAIGKDLRFTSECGVPLATVITCLRAESSGMCEEEVVRLVNCFNDSYVVDVTLFGEKTGRLRMKTYDKKGRLLPSFVIDYNDGTSAYLQIII